MARPTNPVPPSTRIRMTRHSADPCRIRGTAYAMSGLEYSVESARGSHLPARAGWALEKSRIEEGRCRVDRCALFVDAGYVLTDGAMAARDRSQGIRLLGLCRATAVL